ncbi:MAG: hypothetical protein AAGF12_07225 [Myxococcota bacterium]
MSEALVFPLIGIAFASLFLFARRLMEARVSRLEARYALAVQHLVNELRDLRPWLRFHGLRPVNPEQHYRS